MRRHEFTIDRDGALVRMVTPRRGRPHEHRCSLASFEAVAHSIDESGDAGFNIEELATRENLPLTQAATEVAFLKERGCVVAVGRRSYPGSSGVHLDAMTEYHTLREMLPG